MKKVIKSKSWILLAALISTNVFAANTYQLSFDLTTTDEPDANAPYFFCNVTDHASIPLGPLGTKIKMQIQQESIRFPNNIQAYDNISMSDINDKYFEVTKGETRGAGTILITASNSSDITCMKGKGDRKDRYIP